MCIHVTEIKKKRNKEEKQVTVSGLSLIVLQQIFTSSNMASGLRVRPVVLQEQ